MEWNGAASLRPLGLPLLPLPSRRRRPLRAGSWEAVVEELEEQEAAPATIYRGQVFFSFCQNSILVKSLDFFAFFVHIYPTI